MTTIPELATAYECKHGVQAICPTTGIAYITKRAVMSTVGGRRVAWCDCRICDALGHTRDQKEYDLTQPQKHPYYLDPVRYAK